MEIRVKVIDKDSGISKQLVESIFKTVSEQCKNAGCQFVETLQQYNDITTGNCFQIELVATDTKN